MTWIDDDQGELRRLHQSAAELESREREIASFASKIYEELWRELASNISEADNKGIRKLLTNGAAYERKIIIPQDLKTAESGEYPKEYILRLSKNRQAITLTGPEISVVLQLGVGEDHIVQIRHNGENAEISEIAKLLLRPLLFPALFPSK